MSLSAGFHPESNGQSERLNQDLETTLKCMTANNHPLGLYSLCGQKTLTIPFAPLLSPFECQFGYTHPLFPEQEVEVAVSSAQQFDKRCCQTWKKQWLKLLKVSQEYQHQANRRRRPAPTLRPGQRVWLSTKNIPSYLPFILALVFEDKFHFSCLTVKPCSSPFLSTGKPPPPRIIGGQPAYTFHRIVHGSRQYLVDWEGFGPEERSWVPAKDILDPKLIQEFHACKSSHPGVNVRSRS